MLLSTHISMGRYLLKLIDLYDPKSFIKGIREPDIDRWQYGWRHTRHSSFTFVERELKDLKYVNIDDMVFSYKLGIIVHFIMDYTCKYHLTDTMYRKTMRHVLYELCMVYKWLSLDKLHASYLLRHIISYYKYDPDTIKISEFITASLIETYEKEESSYIRDIFYGLSISLVVMRLIIYKTQHKLPID